MAYADQSPIPKLPLWALLVLFALYLFPGLLGHEPWRGDDAEHFGVVHHMLQSGDWLVPSIAGRPFVDYQPLYYWLSALCATLFAWLLPLHDAARLASALCVGAAAYLLANTAKRLYGDRADRGAALLMIGTLGLLTHAHEFQPQLALLMCSAGAFLGFAEFPTQPRRGALIAGVSIALAFLAGGLPALLLLMPLWVLLPSLCRECRGAGKLPALAMGAAIPVALVLLWCGLLLWLRPQAFALWRHQELADITPHIRHLGRLDDLLALLSWFMWPLWPLAGWALWRQRKVLDHSAYRLPLLALLLALALVSFSGPLRPAHALPLIPPLVLLAASGVQTLRRGAASAFDWFGRMSFAGFAVFVWLAWYALHFGWPRGLARNTSRLVPGYVPEVSALAVAFAIALSVAWIALMLRTPRSPIRGTLSWAAGVSFLWALVVLLLQPAVDHDKNYRPLSAMIASQLGSTRPACVIEAGLGPSQLAALNYFDQLSFVSAHSAQAASCQWWLSYQGPSDASFIAPPGWEKVWEQQRGRRRIAERFTLYQRR